MSTSRVNHAAPVVREIVQSGAFSREPFVLVDVGASGGIADHWRQFEPGLAAFGFEPLVRECERLNRVERNPAVRYFDRVVGWDGYREQFPRHIEDDPVRGWSNQPFARTSAARLQAAQGGTYVQTSFNAGDPDLTCSDQRISLDEFFTALPEVRVDFVKVDTDGHDYEVLRGACGMLASHQVLGLLVEVQFHGVSHPHANLFANIDSLLRERGFSLFDVEMQRYTRDLLPGHFVHRIPAQTREGQIVWGEALYLRDVGAPGYEERWPPPLPTTKLLKLICLFEMFGLADCAAELLVRKRDACGSLMDVDRLLDRLAGEVHPQTPSFAKVNRRFEETPESFYPTLLKERLRRAIPRPLRRVLKGLLGGYLR